MIADTAARSQLLQSRLRGLQFLSLDTPRPTSAGVAEALSTLLPDGMPFSRSGATGSFVEILSAQEGAGAYALALALARPSLARREAWAVVDSEGAFYPPAAAAMGFKLSKLVLLRPRPDDDAWAFTQLLRAADISVCFWATTRMDSMVFRRLQLAAERGGGLGFVLRPAAAERRPCWAPLRFMTSWSPGAEPRQLRVRVLHASGRCVDPTREIEVLP